MRESERKNIGINDQEELMNIWIKSVNEAAEGESGLPSYAENNENVARLEQLYTEGDQDFIFVREDAIGTDKRPYDSVAYLFDYHGDKGTANFRAINNQGELKSPETDRAGTEYPYTETIKDDYED